MDYQDEFYAELGTLIRRARTSRDLTQEELAGLLSLNRTSITNIEKGKQKILVHTLIEIAKWLEVSVNDLLPSIHQTPKTLTISNLLSSGNTEEERNFLETVLRHAKREGKGNESQTKTNQNIS